jgi:hypothetical protein
VKTAAAAGEAGGDVQQPVAEFLGLGGGQFAVQQQDASPGKQRGALAGAQLAWADGWLGDLGRR